MIDFLQFCVTHFPVRIHRTLTFTRPYNPITSSFDIYARTLRFEQGWAW